MLDYFRRMSLKWILRQNKGNTRQRREIVIRNEREKDRKLKVLGWLVYLWKEAPLSSRPEGKAVLNRAKNRWRIEESQRNGHLQRIARVFPPREHWKKDEKSGQTQKSQNGHEKCKVAHAALHLVFQAFSRLSTAYPSACDLRRNVILCWSSWRMCVTLENLNVRHIWNGK